MVAMDPPPGWEEYVTVVEDPNKLLKNPPPESDEGGALVLGMRLPPGGGWDCTGA